MEILALFFLGVLQGLTEFLPVSSSGHLVLFSKIFGLEENMFLSILLHVATLLSVVVVFRKTIWKLVKNPFSKQTLNLYIATIPTCVIVIILLPFIKMSFGGNILPFCFLFSAVFLFLSEKMSKRKSQKPIDFRSAFWIGVAQGFAVFPGISRSGATIGAGLFCERDKTETTQFSFLLSLPIIVLSMFMEIFEFVSQKQTISLSVAGIIVSFVSAFFVGVFAIKTMVKLTQKANLKWFSVYLLFISILSLFVL